MKSHWLDTVALILLVVGGLNWGMVAFGFNLVEFIAAGNDMVANAIYGLVGISALYIILSAAIAWTNHRRYFAHQ